MQWYVFEYIEDEFLSIKFIKIDTDSNSETAIAQDIRATPTIRFYKLGKAFRPQKELLGLSEVQQKLESTLEKLKNY